MPFSAFHPIIARWFSETLGEPTRAQALGWAAIRDRRHTLIAAPTGSGKTLAAFLNALDELVHDGLAAPLPDEVRILYVSPLKALSADVHKNLALPRRGIARYRWRRAPILRRWRRDDRTRRRNRTARLPRSRSHGRAV